MHKQTAILSPSPVPRRQKLLQHPVVLAAGLILLTIATYLPVLWAGFIWDDDQYVQQNMTLRSVAGLVRMWTQLKAIPQYYPLTHTTFWIEYHLWGVHPMGYHAVNVLLHAASAVILWRLLLRLKVPGAILVAAIFAVHPIHVESVAWVTERKNILAWFFYLLAFSTYWRMLGDTDEATEPTYRLKPYLLTLLLFAAALFSKTTTSTFPAALLLVIWWKRGRIQLRDILPIVPMILMGAALGSVTSWMERNFVGASGPEWSFTIADRILIAGRAICFYAGKTIWPANLTFIYPRWTISSSDLLQWLFPAGVLVCVSVLLLLRQRIGRAPLVAVLLFCGTLTPALGFFNVYPMLFSFVADHFAYPATIGLIVLIVALVARSRWLGELPKVALGVAVVLVCAVLSSIQTLTYYDLQTLWTDTLEKNPHAWIAGNNLATYLLESSEGLPPENKIDVARQLEPVLAQALADKPSFYQARLNMGIVQRRLGETQKALDLWRSILASKSTQPQRTDNLFRSESAYQIAWYYESTLHDTAQAAKYYDKAIELDGNQVDALRRRARICVDQGDYDRAEQLLQAASRLFPDAPAIWSQIGELFILSDRPANAMVAYQRALDLNPRHTPSLCGIAMALTISGKIAEAQQQLARLAPADAQLPEALTARGLLLVRQGQPAQARQLFERAIQLNPEDAIARKQPGLQTGSSTRPSSR